MGFVIQWPKLIKEAWCMWIDMNKADQGC